MTVDWEKEAYRLLARYIRGEFQAVETELEDLLTELEETQSIEHIQLLLVRSQVELFIETVTDQLSDLEQIDTSSEVEEFERVGREVYRAFHAIAYSRCVGGSVSEDAYTQAEEALQEARQQLTTQS